MADQEPHAFQREIRKTVGAKYLLYLPESYGREPGKRWPLILFLHGAGERGDDLERVKIHNPIRFLTEHPELGFIVVSPLCPAGEVWSVEVLSALLDEIEQKYAVDPDSIYLTGLSMGGYGTFALAVSDPGRFAAIAPICGGGQPLMVRAEHGRLAAWVFHGARDKVIPIQESVRMVEALRNAGAQVRFTVYPEAEHNSWTETYSNPELYEWFLQHRRGQ